MSAAAPGVFVTGTDTGVGKTFIACHLLQVWRQAGWVVAPRKPVESGCLTRDGRLIPADARALAQAAGWNADTDWTAVTHFCLAEPLAPDLAARRQGRPLVLQELITAADHPPGTRRLTEGAGGFYSPLCEDGLNADLAVALGDPVLLVAEDRLGTLNVCLLTLEALERRGLRLAGIVLNRRRQDVHPGLDNANTLAQYTSAPIISIAEDENPACIRNALALLPG